MNNFVQVTCFLEWQLQVQMIPGEVYTFRERIRILMRIHIRNRSFSWRRRGLWWPHESWQWWIEMWCLDTLCLGPSSWQLAVSKCRADNLLPTESQGEYSLWEKCWDERRMLPSFTGDLQPVWMRTTKSPMRSIRLAWSTSLKGAMSVFFLVLLLVTENNFNSTTQNGSTKENQKDEKECPNSTDDANKWEPITKPGC